MAKILVFNPNSSRSMTEVINRSLDPVRAGINAEILCETNDLGPPGIETDEQVATVARHVEAAATASDAEIFIASCFSDPGVAQTRKIAPMPVLGIAESAYQAARSLTDRFGVFSIVEASIRRHAQHLERLNLQAFCVADRSLNLSVAASGDEATIHRLVEVGTILRDEDRAEVLVLGCAGLGGHRARLEQMLGIAVIDPVRAAVIEAAARLGQHVTGRANRGHHATR